MVQQPLNGSSPGSWKMGKDAATRSDLLDDLLAETQWKWEEKKQNKKLQEMLLQN